MHRTMVAVKRGEKKMWTAIIICIAVFFAIKSWRTQIILKAMIYFMVDKGYTAPTQEEIKQYIRLVTKKSVEEWIK